MVALGDDDAALGGGLANGGHPEVLYEFALVVAADDGELCALGRQPERGADAVAGQRLDIGEIPSAVGHQFVVLVVELQHLLAHLTQSAVRVRRAIDAAVVSTEPAL
jgi:hypothetical protein